MARTRFSIVSRGLRGSRQASRIRREVKSSRVRAIRAQTREIITLLRQGDDFDSLPVMADIPINDRDVA